MAGPFVDRRGFMKGSGLALGGWVAAPALAQEPL